MNLYHIYQVVSHLHSFYSPPSHIFSSPYLQFVYLFSNNLWSLSSRLRPPSGPGRLCKTSAFVIHTERLWYLLQPGGCEKFDGDRPTPVEAANRDINIRNLILSQMREKTSHGGLMIARYIKPTGCSTEYYMDKNALENYGVGYI